MAYGATRDRPPTQLTFAWCCLASATLPYCPVREVCVVGLKLASHASPRPLCWEGGHEVGLQQHLTTPPPSYATPVIPHKHVLAGYPSSNPSRPRKGKHLQPQPPAPSRARGHQILSHVEDSFSTSFLPHFLSCTCRTCPSWPGKEDGRARQTDLELWGYLGPHSRADRVPQTSLGLSLAGREPTK